MAPYPQPGGGGGRIRTYEGISQQIYSLPPLAAWVPLLKMSRVFCGARAPLSTSSGTGRCILEALISALMSFRDLSGQSSRPRIAEEWEPTIPALLTLSCDTVNIYRKTGFTI